jgi:thiamine pyrophosphokinase
MEEAMNCIIISGGILDPNRSLDWGRRLDTLLKTADLIIAADRGASHLQKMGYLPHIIIGDMDSIDTGTLEFFKEKGVRIYSHPVKKNQTDTELCITYAMEQKADHITFLAATGTRLDHTLANIFLLEKLAAAGIRSRILDAQNELFLVKDRLELTGKPKDLISLIPVSQKVEGVTLQGVAYPLRDYTLFMGSTRGISNYLTDKKAVITIRSGILIVTRSMD